MPQRYSDLNSEERYLEYALQILHHCLTPEGFGEAEVFFKELTEDATENYPHRSSQVSEAHEQFLNLQQYKEHASFFATSSEFIKVLSKMRDILLENIV